MANKQFVVIGLGRFGAAVAKTLYSTGNDVLAIDKDEDLVQEVSDDVTHAVQMDASDEHALRTLGLRNFDVAIVSIGDNIQASIMVTLLLKEVGVKYIVAKGNSALHAKVLKKIGADRVVLPEQDMGIRVAHNLLASSILDFIELSPDYSVMEIEVVDNWDGDSLEKLNLRSKYGITVMAIKDGKKVNVSPSAEQIVKTGDILVVIGSLDDLTKIETAIAKFK